MVIELFELKILLYYSKIRSFLVSIRANNFKNTYTLIYQKRLFQHTPPRIQWSSPQSLHPFSKSHRLQVLPYLAQFPHWASPSVSKQNSCSLH